MSWLDSRQLALGGVHVSLEALLIAIVIVTAGFVLASLLATKVRGDLNVATARQRWRGTLAQVTGYTIRLLTLAIALQIAGIHVASLLAAGAVVAVGIGIAMQKVAENFVSGIILIAERSIREGDIVEFEGRIARIQHMGIRATIALTLDDEEIIVPNSILAQSAVKNLTLTEPVQRIRVRVGVSYSANVDVVEAILFAAAEGIEWRDKRHAPIVLLTEFGSSSVDFDVSVWTPDVWGQRRGQSELRKAVWRALQAKSISMPFPQLDVHFDQRKKDELP